MEKRRIRLEINGVVCGLITEESEEYMEALAGEVGEMMRNIQEASPYITREAAALTAALGYCDDAKKNGGKAFSLQERIDELEVEAELWQEEKEEMAKSGAASQPDQLLLEKLEKLERENTVLAEAAGRVKELEEQMSRLTDENTALREHSAQADSNRGETDQLTLREAEELSARAEQAEREKEKAIAAAKRAVEEAKKMVDRLQEELAAAKKEAEEANCRIPSPALDLLEQEAHRQSSQSGDASSADAPSADAKKIRKNPMRFEEEYEQEGFVSFFEKK